MIESLVSSITDFLQLYLIKFEVVAIGYLFIANTSYALLLFFGFINSRKKYAQSKTRPDADKTINDLLPPISIIMPAYNESATIRDSLQSMLRLNYPLFEVIVVNDGSLDNTLECLIDEFNLVTVEYKKNNIIPTKKVRNVYMSSSIKNLIVIDKENGKKGDALNAGINYSNYPLICCLDSDGILDEKGLSQICLPFFENPEETVAVGGTIRVINDTEVYCGRVRETKISWNYFSIIQIVEYLRAFLVGRMGWDYIRCNTIVSGAFGLFKKDVVIEIGGYGKDTIGEDLELLLRIESHCLKKKRPFQVHFLPDPICWTEVPHDFKTLGNQRRRWQQGLAEGLWRARKTFFRPWSGRIGNLALPYLFTFELISAPIELFSYFITILGVALGLFSWDIVLLFICVSIIYGMILTLGAILIESYTFRKYRTMKDYFFLILGTILEQFGFRQIHLWWRIQGIYNFLIKKDEWGKMKRKGLRKKGI